MLDERRQHFRASLRTTLPDDGEQVGRGNYRESRSAANSKLLPNVSSPTETSFAIRGPHRCFESHAGERSGYSNFDLCSNHCSAVRRRSSSVSRPLPSSALHIPYLILFSSLCT